MYHGWQALVPTESTGGYRYTHPDTKEEFRRLHREVLEPLGPTLLQVGEHRGDVAFLDSFTAQMFARRGSYGYSNDETYLTLLHAQLQPVVIHEEQLLRHGLDEFKVLVLADCDVLTSGVVKRIREFQQRGGIIIGDENVAPAITPDIRIRKFTRQKKADADKAVLLANAAKLRAALDARYARPVDSTNPEIITRLRHGSGSDYVFVVNDRREAGSYVGQHGLVMENGLPGEGEVVLVRQAGHVYDLTAGREVPAAARDGMLRWQVKLAPCDGSVFMITPRPIAGVKLTAPDSAMTGVAIPVSITITDDAGKPVAGVVPVRLEISDPAGRIAERSGWYGAAGGGIEVRLDPAPNDAPGVWQIRARELASGREAVRYFRVTRP
jgi:hypothetical protein